MKIQDLAIILIIIIIPISIVLSVYTQFQISTIGLQSEYDTKLTSATYDAIKAFQLNTANSTMSDLSNSKLRDIEASIATFKNSIMSTFGLNGYTSEDLNSYIPALVYTMYDGFYIYSPYENKNYLYEIETKADGTKDYKRDENGNKIPLNNNNETIYGLKPYITYSCRYRNSDMDIIITYSLDNYISVQGTINGKYVNDEGYLIDGITKDSTGKITYNGIEIVEEKELKEYVPVTNADINNKTEYPYIKLNGTKYYYYQGNPSTVTDDEIFYISNGQIVTQGEYKGEKARQYYDDIIRNNILAYEYYNEAYNFTKRVREQYRLDGLKYEDAIDAYKYEKDAQGNVIQKRLWEGNTKKIFESTSVNIENEMSSFNQHRLAVIRNKIETNLTIAIANYNRYSKATDVRFQMPELKEEEWDLVINNISLMSFVQGLYIGGKTYNGYTIVNNTESKEVVLEENIYILGQDNYYHKIGDTYLTTATNIKTGIPAGRLNLDFKRKIRNINTSSTQQTVYYYPMQAYNASYNSIVTQNNMQTFNDIYEYINNQNDKLKSSFYIALGRERRSSYKIFNQK